VGKIAVRYLVVALTLIGLMGQYLAARRGPASGIAAEGAVGATSAAVQEVKPSGIYLKE